MALIQRWGFILVTCTFLYLMFKTVRGPGSRSILARGRESRSKADPMIETMKGKISLSEIEKNIFNKFGYKVVDPTPVIPRLVLIEEQSCEKIFKDWAEVSKNIDETAPPPKLIPAELRDSYTLFGYIGLIEDYMDDRSGSHSATWSKEIIDHMISSPIDTVSNYGDDGQCIYHAMTNDSVAGKKGFVIGSLSPWVEAIALKRGAAHVTTLEYMKITSTDSRVDYFHPVELAKQYDKHVGIYDFAISFSSIEHSGLGRFGDVLDPIGDLREMRKAKCMLKQGGLFYFTVPYGFDTTHWNLHRIYGRIRLAMMFEGFEVIGACFKNKEKTVTEADFQKPPKVGPHIQPVLVLRKL